jgi:spermidine synthase
MPTRKEAPLPTQAVPFVSHEHNSKSLHFSNHQEQSKMLLSQPNELAVDYTRTMMGFLLLKQNPRHILMIGLGGGSLAKFCHQHLPDTELTVIEINPLVIALRGEFQVPEDGERFHVIEADGANFMRETDQLFDVVLVDGFDQQGQPAQLCSQHFYEDCSRVLEAPGVLVVNLHDDHAFYEVFIDRINRSFDSNLAEVSANDEGNVIIFAGKGVTVSPYALRNAIQGVQDTWSEHPSFTADVLQAGRPLTRTVT